MAELCFVEVIILAIIGAPMVVTWWEIKADREKK